MENLKDAKHIMVISFFSTFASTIVYTAITDVTMSALCPGQDECSLAIYLTGMQQTIVGVGTIVTLPVIGKLSDRHGRKTLLTVSLSIAIIPLATIAYSRATGFFYAYYVLSTLSAIVGDGCLDCLSLAYLGDIISEGQRALVFGILSGVQSAAVICGTMVSRFLSTASSFQIAAFISTLAAVYMRIFLKEKPPVTENLTEPILPSEPDDIQDDDHNVRRKALLIESIPSVGDLICLLRRSVTFLQATLVAFFYSLADGGKQACMMYYLKARFQFTKNEYADLMLLSAVGGTVSQLLFMPFLSPFISEQKLISIGLIVGFLHELLYSIAWSAWVPYATAVFSIFTVFVAPSIRSIISKQVGHSEQGKAQGCLSGVISFGNIISPLIFSSLTAQFLSEDAPFNFPGFAMFCIGLTRMIAFVPSAMIKSSPGISSHEISTTGLKT